MMKHAYKGLTLFMAGALLFSSPTVVFADDDDDDDREEISYVSLTIEADYDDEDLESVENMDLDIYTDDDTYYVDDFEITGLSSSHPVVEVTLNAEDEYYFSVSSDDINLDGEDGDVTSKSTKNDRQTLVLKIKLTDISTEIDSNDLGDVTLDSDGVGHWDDVGNAKKYEVRFYRGNSAVDSIITTKNTEYYFGSMIEESGTYSFKVRAVSVDDEKSEWVESNERRFSYDPDDASPTNFSSDDNYDKKLDSSDSSKTSGPKSSSDRRDDEDEDRYDDEDGSWRWDRGWWYENPDGSYPADDWAYIDDDWFHFDENGYIQTGWIWDNGSYYYLNPISDGTLGAMVTGWQLIDGVWYYFNPSSNGVLGEMLHDTVIDGQYRLNSDGAWIP